MSVMDDLVTAVNASTKLDAGTKSVIVSFLASVSPSLGTLSTEAIDSLMSSFAGGDTAAAIEPLAATLSAAQAAAALAETDQALTSELSVRETQIAAAKSVISALESAALSVLAKAIIAAV